MCVFTFFLILFQDDYSYRNSSNYRKRRSASPKDHESRKRYSESPRRQDHNKKVKGLPEIVIDDTDYDTPDRSFGDLYCKACDSHMNSEQMWEAHIQGKRHQKHTKKGDHGEMKYEILKEDPLILPEIKKSSEPIIGLQHCCEIRRLEGKPIYNCFLCSANVPNGQFLIEHVIGLKHRMAYLKEHDPVKHDLIDKTNLKKGMIEPVVAECIRLHQDKHGTGTMQVKLDLSKPSVSSSQSYKKPYQDIIDNNVKRGDRRTNYVGDRDEDYRHLDHKQQEFQRGGHFSDDPYDERYLYSSDNVRDRRCYGGGESPRERRSPIRFDYSHHETTQQPSVSQTRESDADLRVVLEQRRMQERAATQSNNSNLFQSLLKIIETMPSMMFLELVLHRVEKMDPTEDELSMLQKIGNHMISIVMNRKLQKLSPDLLGKYQSNPKQEDESNKSTNNLNSLMNLVSQFNSKKASSSFNWMGDSQPEKPPTAPAFMTQTPGSFYSSSSVTQIPGLTLSDETQGLYDASSSFRNTSSYY
ncbi:uncharacterized protein [Parasteatoda tepidariorum]|uniref:uncharacterized protein isoform X1 n=2 Tax=Parasteatoda tepidariorum TaxID=114398 RepID=UPI001C71B0E9|nr:uncharacterized protein LOC107457188 isoform X1 [Parasteatoda tepidariorum]